LKDAKIVNNKFKKYKMKKIKAFQIGDSIDIKQFRAEFTAEVFDYSSSDIFYVNADNTYLYILSYGVVVFSGYEELKMTEHIEFLKNYTKNPLNTKILEELVVYENSENDKFGHNEVYLSRFSPQILKIIMLNIAQSVILDYYQQKATQMVEEMYNYTAHLERNGKLAISNKTLLKFVGKILNVKNDIIDQLYIIAQPDETWEDEYLSKIDAGIRAIFDIKIRFKNLDYNLQIVKENLDIFMDLMHHKRSNMLEIIIIILIMVEVVNLFIEKIIN